MNKCIFIGTLARDPELKTLNGGGKVTRFTLIVGRRFFTRDGKRVNKQVYVECEVWDRSAVHLAENYKEGDLMTVEASVDVDVWHDEGKKRVKTKFRVNDYGRPGESDGDTPFTVTQTSSPENHEEGDIPF